MLQKLFFPCLIRYRFLEKEYLYSEKVTHWDLFRVSCLSDKYAPAFTSDCRSVRLSADLLPRYRSDAIRYWFQVWYSYRTLQEQATVFRFSQYRSRQGVRGVWKGKILKKFFLLHFLYIKYGDVAYQAFFTTLTNLRVGVWKQD